MKFLKKITIGLIVLSILAEFNFSKSMFQLKLFVQSFSIFGAIILFFISRLPMWKE